MRYTRRHGAQRTMYDHVVRDQEQRKRQCDEAKADRDNTICTCGAITALLVCPYCGGERPLAKENT